MAPSKELSLSVDEKNKAAMAAILSSFSYSFCSVSMVMSNKASLSRSRSKEASACSFSCVQRRFRVPDITSVTNTDESLVVTLGRPC